MLLYVYNILPTTPPSMLNILTMYMGHESGASDTVVRIEYKENNMNVRTCNILVYICQGGVLIIEI